MDWIKVTPETMPPDGQEVIATVRWRNEKRIEFGLYREDNEWCQDYDGMDGGGTTYYSDDEVTHWTSYPEPAEDLCEFCISYNSMKEHMKKSCTGTFLECAIVEETTLFGTGNKKFPLWIIDKNGPRDFNGFQLNFCPECGKKLLED